MKHKSSRLSDSRAMKGRNSETEQLEMRRLEIKKEIEKLMTEYAKITGNKELLRSRPVGTAPNDWRAEDHDLG